MEQLVVQLTSLWASDQQCYLKYQPADVIGWRKSGFYIIIIIIFFPPYFQTYTRIHWYTVPPTFREDEFDYNVRFK